MNYLKTKTIQKQRAIIGSGFLSSLLLFFLLVSCFGGNNASGEGSGSPRPHESQNPNQTVGDQFKTKLGGWGPCTGVCFLNQVREDAEQNNKTKSINDVKSFLLPKKSPKNGQVLYFAGLLTEKIVGNTDGVKKWKKHIKNLKGQAKFNLDQGPHGVFVQIANAGLGSTGSFSRATGLYVVYQYMLFIDEARKIVDGKDAKDAKKQNLESALGKLRTRLSKVGPDNADTKGIVLIIPVDKQTYEPETEVSEAEKESGAYFLERKAKKMQMRKNFVLTKNEQAEFEKINKEIEGLINEFVDKLS